DPRRARRRALSAAYPSARRTARWRSALTASAPIRILVDADACPVKEEIYRVAARHRVRVSVVSNSPFRVPVGPLVERVVVHGGFDAADDWIAQRADPRAVVVTADILLADRCLKAGACVLAPTGKPFTAA